MKIGDILRPESVIVDIQAQTKKDILTELSKPIAQAYDINLEEMVDVLLNREKLGSTGIGEGVAIPHGKIPGLKTIVAAVGKNTQGLKFDSLDGKLCHIFFLLVAPSNSVSGHLKALARASMLLKNPALREDLMKTTTPQDLYAVLIQYDNKLDE